MIVDSCLRCIEVFFLYYFAFSSVGTHYSQKAFPHKDTDWCVCMCMCVCVCARVRVCVFARAHARVSPIEARLNMKGCVSWQCSRRTSPGRLCQGRFGTDRAVCVCVLVWRGWLLTGVSCSSFGFITTVEQHCAAGGHTYARTHTSTQASFLSDVRGVMTVLLLSLTRQRKDKV